MVHPRLSCRDTGAIATKMRDAVSGADLPPVRPQAAADIRIRSRKNTDIRIIK